MESKKKKKSNDSSSKQKQSTPPPSKADAATAKGSQDAEDSAPEVEIVSVTPATASCSSHGKKKEYNFDLKSAHIFKGKHGKKMFNCDVCSAVYRHSFSLKRHFIRTHINYAFLSETDVINCGINLNSSASLMEWQQSYYDTRDKVDMPGVYCCHSCVSFYDTIPSLKVHLNESHRSEQSGSLQPVRIPCTQCNMSFIQRHNLIRHIEVVHEGLQPYACDECDERFKSPMERKKHQVKIHGAGSDGETFDEPQEAETEAKPMEVSEIKTEIKTEEKSASEKDEDEKTDGTVESASPSLENGAAISEPVAVTPSKRTGSGRSGSSTSTTASSSRRSVSRVSPAASQSSAATTGIEAEASVDQDENGSLATNVGDVLKDPSAEPEMETESPLAEEEEISTGKVELTAAQIEFNQEQKREAKLAHIRALDEIVLPPKKVVNCEQCDFTCEKTALLRKHAITDHPSLFQACSFCAFFTFEKTTLSEHLETKHKKCIDDNDKLNKLKTSAALPASATPPTNKSLLSSAAGSRSGPRATVRRSANGGIKIHIRHHPRSVAATMEVSVGSGLPGARERPPLTKALRIPGRRHSRSRVIVSRSRMARANGVVRPMRRIGRRVVAGRSISASTLNEDEQNQETEEECEESKAQGNGNENTPKVDRRRRRVSDASTASTESNESPAGPNSAISAIKKIIKTRRPRKSATASGADSSGVSAGRVGKRVLIPSKRALAAVETEENLPSSRSPSPSPSPSPTPANNSTRTAMERRDKPRMNYNIQYLQSTQIVANFNCTVCYRRFADYDTLTRHKQLHHNSFRTRNARATLQARSGRGGGGLLSRRDEMYQVELEKLREDRFYSTLAQSIAENLLYHVDGRVNNRMFANKNADASRQQYIRPFVQLDPRRYNLPNDYWLTRDLASLSQELPKDHFLSQSGLHSRRSHGGHVSSAGLISRTNSVAGSNAGGCETSLPPRYICTACKEILPTIKSFPEHKENNHPNVHCRCIEVDAAIPLEDLFHDPTHSVGVLARCPVAPSLALVLRPTQPGMEAPKFNCSSCGNLFASVAQLHKHILECQVRPSSAAALITSAHRRPYVPPATSTPLPQLASPVHFGPNFISPQFGAMRNPIATFQAKNLNNVSIATPKTTNKRMNGMGANANAKESASQAPTNSTGNGPTNQGNQMRPRIKSKSRKFTLPFLSNSLNALGSDTNNNNNNSGEAKMSAANASSPERRNNTLNIIRNRSLEALTRNAQFPNASSNLNNSATASSPSVPIDNRVASGNTLKRRSEAMSLLKPGSLKNKMLSKRRSSLTISNANPMPQPSPVVQPNVSFGPGSQMSSSMNLAAFSAGMGLGADVNPVRSFSLEHLKNIASININSAIAQQRAHQQQHHHHHHHQQQQQQQQQQQRQMLPPAQAHQPPPGPSQPSGSPVNWLSFAFKGTTQQHYTCEHCKRGFTYLANYRKHISSVCPVLLQRQHSSPTSGLLAPTTSSAAPVSVSAALLANAARLGSNLTITPVGQNMGGVVAGRVEDSDSDTPTALNLSLPRRSSSMLLSN